jgi:hypothetical protein
MKSLRDEMEIVNAYELVGTYRGAAALCGTTAKTVKRALERRLVGQVGRRPTLPRARNTAAVTQLIVERVHHWVRHFGPLSGSEPKLADPAQRYILTAFTFGCNLGPTQAARHLQGLATAHELSFTNRRHVSVDQLDAAIKDLINAYHRCDLPKVWGSGSSASADGTLATLRLRQLEAER